MKSMCIDPTVTSALIAAGSALVIVIVDKVVVFLQSKKTSKQHQEILTQNALVLEHSKSAMERQTLSAKIEGLKKKLNEFYKPLRGLLDLSQNFYFLFRQGKPDGFRTLTYLILRNQGKAPFDLTSHDEMLLKEIFALGEKIESFILEKGHLIETGELRMSEATRAKLDSVGNDIPFKKAIQEDDLLSLAAAHFRLIRLAYNGLIDSNVDSYAAYVYPLEFPAEIGRRIEELELEIKGLESKY